MRSVAFAGLVATLLLLNVSPVRSETAPLLPGTRTIVVSGHGDIKAKPDLMTVSFAVDSTGATGEQCTKLQTEKTQKLIDALKAISGSTGKIDTSEYSLNYHEETGNLPAIQSAEAMGGWTFKATITAGSEDMANLGAVLDAGLAAGAFDIAGSGVEPFPVDNATSSANKKFGTQRYLALGLAITDQPEPPTKQMVSVAVEVETRGATANEAVREGVRLDDKVAAAMQSQLAAGGAVKLDNFTILRSSQAGTPPATLLRQVPQRIYDAHTAVAVTTRKLDALGSLIEAGMKAGATRLNSVNFTLNDPAAAGQEAIAAAAKNAQGKAAALANSMNVKLGKILSISNTVQVQPQMLNGGYLMERMAGSASETAASTTYSQQAITPVLPQELGVGAEVNVTYEIQ
jgi:uncharacterized protein YggE